MSYIEKIRDGLEPDKAAIIIRKDAETNNFKFEIVISSGEELTDQEKVTMILNLEAMLWFIKSSGPKRVLKYAKDFESWIVKQTQLFNGTAIDEHALTDTQVNDKNSQH